MKNFRLTELGALSKGERFRKEDMSPGTIPYIGAIDSNNGVAAHCEKVEGMKMHPKGSISIPYDGSIGYAFLQPKEFYASDAVTVLTPFTDNTSAKIYICVAIKKERFRFNYGRKWNMDRMKLSKIKLPERNGEPDYDKMAEIVGTEIPDYSHLKNAKSEEKVDLKDWKVFNIQSLFQFEKGTGPSSEDAAASPGETPFINAQKHSNGIMCYTDHQATHKSNCITWVAQGAGASGKAFAQNKPFCSTATVNVLVPKWKAQIEELIFTARIITESEWKFSFGRAVNGNRKNIKISLPTKNGLPNWDGIRQYMNSCKFSATI